MPSRASSSTAARPLASSRLVRITWSPRRASWRAVSGPSPRLAPVIRTVRGMATGSASDVGRFLDEGTGVELADRLLQLAIRVHDDRPVPGDGLTQRAAGDEQEADAFVTCLHRHLVAAV